MLQYLKTKRRNKKISDTPGLLGKPLEKIAMFYSEKVLRFVLKRPVIVGISGLLIATGLLFLAFLTPFEFFPAADEEEVTMNVRLAEGTKIDDTNNEILKIMDEVSNEDDNVKETAIFTGSGLAKIQHKQYSALTMIKQVHQNSLKNGNQSYASVIVMQKSSSIQLFKDHLLEHRLLQRLKVMILKSLRSYVTT